MSRLTRTHHHIQRIDNPQKRDHAWVVKIQRRSEIIAHRRFSDGQHGGKRKALQAAIHYRDTILTETNEKKYRHWFCHRKRSDNTSGTIGVGRYVIINRRKPRPVETIFWLAFWTDTNGKRQSRSFSVKLHGEAQAKALALNARGEAMRTLFS